MPIRIDGDNATATPGITGGDADTGLVFGTDEVSVVTGGTEQVKVDSSGRLLVGTSTARSPLTHSPSIQVEGLGYAASTVSITSNSNDTNGSYFFLGKSRGTSLNSNTVVQSGDEIGGLDFIAADGTQLLRAARITSLIDGTPGSNDMPGRLVFSTTADGASSPTERMRLNYAGRLYCPGVYNFYSAVGANVYVDSNGNLIRATSSGKYKTDVETIEYDYSSALLNCRPVWFRSISENDNPNWGYWGFIAEEVAEIDPRLVHWKTTEVSYDENGSAIETPCDPEPEGVQYDRFVPHLLNLVKRQQAAIETLEAKVAELEANP